MKSTGIVRRLDDLGRVVLPMEIRNAFRMQEKDPVEIYVEGCNIILKKIENDCIFCGNTKSLTEYQEKLLCNTCIEEISQLNQD